MNVSGKGMGLFIPPLCDPTVPLLGPYQMAAYAKKIDHPFWVHDFNIAFLEHIINYARNLALSGKCDYDSNLDSIEYAACLKFIQMSKTVFSYQGLLTALHNCKTVDEYWHLMDYTRACYDLYSFRFNNLRFRIDGLDCDYRWNVWSDIDLFIDEYINSDLTALLHSWVKKINLVEFKVIGVNITFESQLFFALLLCITIRQVKPDAYIVTGGGFVNSFVDSADSAGPLFKYCDTVFAGEGEILLWYLKNLPEEGRLPPFVLPKDICKEKLAVYPPSISAEQCEKYFSPAKVIPLRFTYKCYWGKCKFCSDKENHDCLDEHYDYNSMFDFCIKWNMQGVFDCVYFLDSAIPVSVLKMFCRTLLQSGTAFNWGTNARFDDGFADEDFISLLAGAGCVFIKFGLESGSQRMLDLMNKGTNIDTATKTIALCRQYNILVHTYVMFAYPGETKNDRDVTEAFLLNDHTHPDNYNSSEFILYGSAPIAKELNYSFETAKQNEPGWYSASYSFSNDEIKSFISELRGKFDRKYNPAHILLSSGHTIACARKFRASRSKKLLLRDDTVFRTGRSVITAKRKDSVVLGRWRRRNAFVYFYGHFAEILSNSNDDISIEYLLKNDITTQFIFDLVNEGFLEISIAGTGNILQYSGKNQFDFIYGNKFNRMRWYGYYDNS
jgi:hypothetical protein